ncbi:hypothetical protein SAMN05421553_1251 [Pseudomonas anguilliseptica]|uniref:Uncharacterized protein n=1 Tax=Pseudomonas anguilliseptica TaxID=53406 RepID=A0A1H4UFB1_PSEAG|nr:hypothetical protein SAMN05421553_1251 [Pseudomonas anguilliseptica]
MAIELLYGLTTSQPRNCLRHNLFRRPANPGQPPDEPENSRFGRYLRHQYALAGPAYRGTMTRFRIEMVLPCRIPLPSLFP